MLNSLHCWGTWHVYVLTDQPNDFTCPPLKRPANGACGIAIQEQHREAGRSSMNLGAWLHGQVPKSCDHHAGGEPARIGHVFRVPGSLDWKAHAHQSSKTLLPEAHSQSDRTSVPGCPISVTQIHPLSHLLCRSNPVHHPLVTPRTNALSPWSVSAHSPRSNSTSAEELNAAPSARAPRSPMGVRRKSSERRERLTSRALERCWRGD